MFFTAFSIRVFGFYLPLGFILALNFAWAEKAPQSPKTTNSKTLAMLDLVDLSTNKTLPNLSAKLNSQIATIDRFKILDRDEAIKRLEKYNRYLFVSCNDPQCAFDLGGMLETDYILFGTATRYEDMGILTLKLMNLADAKIVWSHILTSKADVESMEQSFKNFAQSLKNASFNSKRIQDDALMAVLAFGDTTIAGKIVTERVYAHAYQSEHYEVMSSTETAELFSALEIDPSNIENSLFAIKDLGKKLGVKAILYSAYGTEGVAHKHGVSLFDIKSKSVILSMPPFKQSSFRHLLSLEKSFFVGMEKILSKKSLGKSKK